MMDEGHDCHDDLLNSCDSGASVGLGDPTGSQLLRLKLDGWVGDGEG
jgi:hypothetical protein